MPKRYGYPMVDNYGNIWTVTPFLASPFSGMSDEKVEEMWVKAETESTFIKGKEESAVQGVFSQCLR